jgi:NAD(P)-dependent dehydrogenase (short-subunit alcohol dehydrogenase family)
MSRLAIITGASSGIGAALTRTAPADVGVILGVSRRPPPRGTHHAADLADPATWPPLLDAVGAALRERPAAAMLLHFAGTMEPTGPVAAVAPGAVADALTLNAVAGPFLAGGFLQACAAAGVPATVVLCSSPAAGAPRPGAAPYCAGKAALETWARVAAQEQREAGHAARVLAVVPWGVDTPMVRAAMDAGPELPLGATFRARAARGELADPLHTAREIWALVDGDAEDVTAVGAVPAG